MKKIIKQISQNYANKAGLNYETDNFDGLEQILRDVTPVIKFADSNDDVSTFSLEEMIDGYFADCYFPEIRITDMQEVVVKLVKAINVNYCDFYCEQTDEIYDYVDDVPNGEKITWNVYHYGRLSDLFAQIAAFSKTELLTLTVVLANVTPDNNDEDNICYKFEKGIVSGGGDICVDDNNSFWYPARLYWLCKAFKGMTADEVEAIGIKIKVFNEIAACDVYECGILNGVRYKYGAAPKLFSEVASTVELIKRYPILLEYAPEAMRRNKQVILSFVKANNEYMLEYRNAIDENTSLEFVTSTSVIRRNMQQAMRNAYPRTVPSGIFEPFYNDVDVLTAVANSLMCGDLTLTAFNYDEQVVANVINNAPQFAITVYDYWKKEITNQPKIAEHIRIINNLNTKMSDVVIALYKCFEVIKSDNENGVVAKGLVLSQAHFEYNSQLIEDCRKDVAMTYRKLDNEMQNYLAQTFYPLLSYIKPDDVDKTLADTVAEECPIAATILPDRYILLHSLVEPEEEISSVCRRCGKCKYSNIRFI